MTTQKPNRSTGPARSIRLAAMLAVAAASLAAGGCGTLYHSNVKSVAVPIWQRGPGVYRRGLEFRLTEAIIKRIELDTPYKVTDKSKADTMLEGTIVRVSQSVLSFNPRLATPRDEQIRIVVRLKWTDLRTGEVLHEERNLRAAGVYYPARRLDESEVSGTVPASPFDEDFFEGSSSAINRMAQLIVEKMEKPW